MTNSNLKKLIGKKIQKLRKLVGLSQEKLAERIDLETNSLSKIETGNRFPSLATLEKLSYYLNLKYSDFFDFENNEETCSIIQSIIVELKDMKEHEQNFVLNFIKFYKKNKLNF